MANMLSDVRANASTEILVGSLDGAHTSTLSGYWINYPTPWPYLLISLALSIGLGWLGFRSSAKSWQPVRKQGRQGASALQGEVETSTSQDADAPISNFVAQPQIDGVRRSDGLVQGEMTWNDPTESMTEKGRHGLFKGRGRTNVIDAERTAEGQALIAAYDVTSDGGVGKFAMYKAIFGIAWTSLRSISIFALSIKIALGFDSSNSAYPDPLSVMVLFTSAQTYLAGRGMPRFFNVILAWDLVLIWIAFVLCSFGHGSTTRFYGKIGVQGGNCPYFDRPKYLSGEQCASGRWTEVGCATNSTWDTDAHDFPRAAWWFIGDPDPNTHGNTLLTFQLDFKLIGIVYGLIVLVLALPLFFLPYRWQRLSFPLPAHKFPFLQRTSRLTSLLAFALVVILSIIAVPLHITTEVNPPTFSYVDSQGPLVPAGVFDSDAAQRAVHGRWPSLAWNQSHGGPALQPVFLGGNETSWSDCFWVRPPGSSTGHLSDWWQAAEGRALRVLGGV